MNRAWVLSGSSRARREWVKVWWFIVTGKLLVLTPIFLYKL